MRVGYCMRPGDAEGYYSSGIVPWTPALAVGGSLWLRADLGITIGGGVAAQADQLGIQPPAAQTIGTQQPVQTPNAVNGQTSLVFNGISQFLTITGFIPPVGATEMWCVAQSTPAVSTPGSLMDFSGEENVEYYPWVDSSIYESFGTNARNSCGVPPSPLSTYHLVSIQASTTWTIFQNGSRFFTNPSNSILWQLNPTLGHSGTYLRGGIAELYIGSTLSTVDRTLTRNYISNRYGFTLGGDWV
jgi:hypothetical protein